MTGDKGPGAKHRLDDNNIVLFQVGSGDWFLVAEKDSLSILNTIDVWVDYSDTSPAWWVHVPLIMTKVIGSQFTKRELFISARSVRCEK